MSAPDPGSAPPVDPRDRAVVEAQLGRPPRAIREVVHRCTCGLVDVIETNPRLPDGTPFPTLFYLTCPRASKEIGRLEASGLMREMTGRLHDDPPSALHRLFEQRRQDVFKRQVLHMIEKNFRHRPASGSDIQRL